MNGIAQARAIVAAKYEAMMAQQQHAEATNRVERIAKSVTGASTPRARPGLPSFTGFT